MKEKQLSAHPFMAGSTQAERQAMLQAVGVSSVEKLFEQVPADHRMTRPLALPRALTSELALSQHLNEVLARNQSCAENLNFLGAGCWQHYVPAACIEVMQRREWLTSVFGIPSSDHGRNQTWFEFSSLLGELLDLDFVGLPVYSWGCAAGHAIRMTVRMTGRREVLVVRAIDPERLSVIRNYCEPPEMASHIDIVSIDFEPGSGRLAIEDLKSKLSTRTAAVYLETPSYLGVIEDQIEAVSELTKKAGARLIVGVDPIALGVLASPASLGADIVVGPTQPLGVPMNCGGGVGGFIASRGTAELAKQYPTLLISITDTSRPGERGFALSLFEQSSYGLREKANDWTGNSVYMWAIVNAVYMSLLGPHGFREVGERILMQSHYAARALSKVAGVTVRFRSNFFKEFVVDFTQTGLTVGEINAQLRARGIFGGKDLSEEFSDFGQSALFCVTEIHRRADIDRLASALKDIVER